MLLLKWRDVGVRCFNWCLWFFKNLFKSSVQPQCFWGCIGETSVSTVRKHSQGVNKHPHLLYWTLFQQILLTRGERSSVSGCYATQPVLCHGRKIKQHNVKNKGLICLIASSRAYLIIQNERHLYPLRLSPLSWGCDDSQACDTFAVQYF